MEELKQILLDFAADFAGITEELNTKFNTVYLSANTLSDDVDDLRNTINDVRQSVSELPNAITVLDNRINSLVIPEPMPTPEDAEFRQELDDVTLEIASIRHRITVIEDTLEQLQNDSKALPPVLNSTDSMILKDKATGENVEVFVERGLLKTKTME